MHQAQTQNLGQVQQRTLAKKQRKVKIMRQAQVNLELI
jgi:hypothetical protein